MKAKFFLVLCFILTPIVAVACDNGCCSCAKGGWQLMDKPCNGPVRDKAAFKACLDSFSWLSTQNNPQAEKLMKEGYIEIGGHAVLNSPTPKAIKVILYTHRAVDLDGNLYTFLLGE
jgi:hypothetical protein